MLAVPRPRRGSKRAGIESSIVARRLRSATYKPWAGTPYPRVKLRQSASRRCAVRPPRGRSSAGSRERSWPRGGQQTLTIGTRVASAPRQSPVRRRRRIAQKCARIAQHVPLSAPTRVGSRPVRDLRTDRPHPGGSMNRKYRFAAGAVTQLQQSLDEIPPCPATELSKQQMIHALAPQIVALRSKGYSWTAVAAMLSERGLPVSVAALRTYLRRIRDESANDKPHTRPKRVRDARADPPRADPLPVTAPIVPERGTTAPLAAASRAVLFPSLRLAEVPSRSTSPTTAKRPATASRLVPRASLIRRTDL